MAAPFPHHLDAYLGKTERQKLRSTLVKLNPLPAGKDLFAQGQQTTNFFIIAKGTADVYVHGPDEVSRSLSARVRSVSIQRLSARLLRPGRLGLGRGDARSRRVRRCVPTQRHPAYSAADRSACGCLQASWR